MMWKQMKKVAKPLRFKWKTKTGRQGGLPPLLGRKRHEVKIFKIHMPAIAFKQNSPAEEEEEKNFSFTTPARTVARLCFTVLVTLCI